MTERVYRLTETQLRTLLESARNGDSIPDIMIGLEDGDIEQVESEIAAWVRDWVDTGEDRLNDEEKPERWEAYAGWLDVGEMPESVRRLLDPEKRRWTYG